MRKYELMFLCGENHTEPKAKEIAREIGQHLTSLGASNFNETYWGKKRLAYKIKNNLFGYYFITQFEAEPAAVAQLTADLNIDERVIRYLITDYVEGNEIPETHEPKLEGEASENAPAKKTEKGPVKKAAKAAPAPEKKAVEPAVESPEPVTAAVTEEVAPEEADEQSVETARQELADKQAKADEDRRAAMEKMIGEIVS